MDAPCMEVVDGKKVCTKGYPKQLQKYTTHGANRYPTYRRRSPQDGGHTCSINMLSKGGEPTTIDNRWVVPYNPYLLLKYKCHINMEIVASVGGIKYMFK